MPTNNGQRRRATATAKKILGKKVAYNENAPRSVLRSYLNRFIKCEKCGDRMLAKNIDEHLRKALLHSAPKATRKKSA